MTPPAIFPLSRRRFITIAAGAAAVSWHGGRHAAARPPDVVRWRGVALGADAQILLPPDNADAILAACRAEVERLERIFSLYRPDSALVALNRAGMLDQPPLEMVDLLATAQGWAARTDGAFDPTVQPLWTLYAKHFHRPGADPAGPSEAAVARARALVDWRALEVRSDRIRLTRPGMAVTLNGIAQGYITDRVADLLRSRGHRHILLALGETRALGPRPDGTPWRVAPTADADTLPLTGGALATSAPEGGPFDTAGRHHHLFDPHTGRSAQRWRRITVAAPTATEADALSTALAVTDVDLTKKLLGDDTRIRAWLI